MKITAEFYKSWYFILFTIAISGLCYFYGDGLNGDFWFLVWMAPIPIICLAMFHSVRTTFIVSFIASLIGRLSWFSYLVSVLLPVPTIIYTVLLSLIFGGIMILTRSAAKKFDIRVAVFAFPVFFTAFEYLLISFSPDGTAMSMAYSQMNCLPLIQIASVTGILGITFVVTLIPSFLAFFLLSKRETGKPGYSLLLPVVIAGIVLLFGFWRLSRSVSDQTIKAGLLVMEENKHNNSDQPNKEKDEAATKFYAGQIDSLAPAGVQVIVLPERALSIDKSSETDMLKILNEEAVKNNICLIAAYTNLRGEKEHNSAIVIDNKGNILSEYNKTFLVNGLEKQFTRGDHIGLFKLGPAQAGIAICKDLDFPKYIRQYGKNETGILFVPAWDFIVDDWLHARMAILRGVENGFSEVRSARTGRLTISDPYGRVTSEAISSNQQNAALTGFVSTEHINTWYAAIGDAIGMICLLLSLVMMIVVFRKKNSTS